MAKSKQSKFEAWIFNSYQLSFEGLGLFRIFTALFILFFILPSTGIYPFLGSLPKDFFSPPPGPMLLFENFPSGELLLIFHYALVISLILVLFGLATKYASLSAGIFLLLIKGFIYSLGKIDHDIILIVVLLVMAFSGWGKAYSIDAFRKSQREFSAQNWTLTLLALIMGFMFFTAGFPKILGGWFDIQTHAVQGHFLKQYFIRGRQDLLAPLALHLPGFVWEFMDYATILFEVGFLLAIFHPRSTRIFICFAVIFHFCTMLILNISFLPNFLAYAAFLNWEGINRWIHKSTSSISLKPLKKRDLPPLLITVVMIAAVAFISFLEKYIHLASDLTVSEIVWVGCSVPVALIYLIQQGLYMTKFRDAINS